ncbi:hypothetical protein KCP77_06100 [Salmonella enterica subsp. enterica]|nr:hypothetical protein KCP77_06100 [Salmonella enterica subsp. enterica]
MEHSTSAVCKARCRLLAGTCAHQNDATDSAGAVHYLVSPPRPPRKTRQSQSNVLTRLEVATRRKRRVLLCMSRASRFIPRTQKKQSINAHNVSIIRNVYRLIFD